MATTRFLMVTYDPGKVMAMWMPATGVAGLTGYRVYIQPPLGVLLSWDTGPSVTSLQIATTVAPGSTICISLLLDGRPEPPSTPLPMIASAPRVTLMTYDVAPSGLVTLRWNGSAEGAVTGYVAVLAEQGGGRQWTEQPQSTEARFAQTLDPAKTYQATVRAVGSGGVVQGPATAPLTAITATTTVMSMVYDLAPAALLSMQWLPVAGANYVTVLNEVGTANQWTQTSSENRVRFAQVLDPTRTYQATVRVTSADGVAQGPATAPLTAITATTAVMSMVYDLVPRPLLSMSWRQVAGASYVTVLDEVGTSNQWTETSQSPQMRFAQTLDPARTYLATVRVTSADGVVQGPATAPLAAITATTSVTSMVYDLAPSPQLSLLWGAVTGAHYVAVLDEVGTANQWTQTPDAPQAQFAQTLDSARTYQATVRVTSPDGVVQGPATAPLTAITGQSSLILVAYDGQPTNLLTVKWTQPPGTQPSGYVAVLSRVGTQDSWIATSTATATRFIQQLDTANTYEVVVRATGSSGIVQGPASTAVTVIAAPVEVRSMVYDLSPAAKLTLEWAGGGATVSGYVAVLNEVGTGRQWSQTPTQPTAVFEQTLNPASTYKATVRATGSGGVAQGPASAPLTAITAPATLTGIDYNPDAFIVTWDPPCDCLIEVTNSMLYAPFPGTGGELTLAITLDASQSYDVAARQTGAGGIVRGPAGNTLSPLLTSPTAPSLGYTGTAFRAGWRADPNPAVTGYLAELLRDGAVAADQPAAASPAQFTAALEAGTVYVSRVRSTGPSVKGPWTMNAHGPYRNTATIDYDGLGRLSRVSRVNAGAEVYAFDSLGNLQTVRHET